MKNSDEPRVLRPGEDYSLWPYMKWARAQQLSGQLYHSVNMQSVSSRSGLDVEIAQDKLSATFLVREAAPMPVHEWSLLLGDVLHNYRSALDALAWELAHLDGRQPHPKHVRQLYFPICISKTEWDRKVKGPFASIPIDIRRRLYAVQPFHAEPVEEGILVILHKLDIADKHKAQVKANAVVRDRSTCRYSFRLEGNQPMPVSGDRPAHEWLTDGSPVRVGQPIFKMNSPIPIEWAESDMPLPLKLTVELGESEYEIFPLLEMIEGQFGATLHILNTGRPPGQPDRIYGPLEEG
ncbi:hypothetical protein G7067_07590 [Leucobacter insecticola]|uniref:Uncharacterized protein n=1 Tax=Leucobacter insecticola TaxID=2714934 RepID=A0A6G8FIW8_9MICO|nr:hypothetical protein [Leucobacter insecticola]QIM16317.1 hypothetical protein G7067_07590 [Leucobacter insecticola]